jgi:hypothetical protein
VFNQAGRHDPPTKEVQVRLASFVPVPEGLRGRALRVIGNGTQSCSRIQRRRRLLGRGEFGLSCVIRREHEKTSCGAGSIRRRSLSWKMSAVLCQRDKAKLRPVLYCVTTRIAAVPHQPFAQMTAGLAMHRPIKNRERSQANACRDKHSDDKTRR